MNLDEVLLLKISQVVIHCILDQFLCHLTLVSAPKDDQRDEPIGTVTEAGRAEAIHQRLLPESSVRV